MSAASTSNSKTALRRKLLKGAAATAGMAVLGAPAISLAQNKTIRIGMPTILSGRVAMLGISSRNAVALEVEKFNAAGGLGGRMIEMVVRDSKGQPQEAARVTRELITGDGCEMILDAEASSGAFAVHEVAKDASQRRSVQRARVSTMQSLAGPMAPRLLSVSSSTAG